MFNYDWNWNAVWTYRGALLEGLMVAIALSGISILAGTFIGLAIGIQVSQRFAPLQVVRMPLLFLVDCVKALPPLILLLLFYYWLPYLIGIQSSFWLATIALAVNLSAFVADVFRHAIDGVPRPYLDAGYALGMTRTMVIRSLIIPEALRVILPTLGLFCIDTFKLSSLASVIAVRELLHRASEISTYSYRFLEVYATLAAIYLMVLLPFSYSVRRLERSAYFMRRS
jgi:polar amino acid transport system permease protein